MALTRPKIGQLQSTTSTLSDPITVLHQGSTSANVDVGFLFNRANGLVSNVALYWNETGNNFVTAFTSNSGITDSNITVTSYANLTTGAQRITPGTTLNSTSTTTGALVVTGGAGISGNLYVGGNVSASNFLGNVFFGPTPTTTYYTQAPLNLTNSLAGGIKTQLNLINTGGGAGAGAGIDFYTYTSVAGSSYPEARIAAVDDGNYSSYITFQTKIPGNTGANALAERIKIDSAGNIVIPTTTVSTSTTIGALVVAGGVGISGALNVGANVTVTGNILPSANISYDLGSPTQRFRTLYISGNTIDMGGAQITTDGTSGGFAFVPLPTIANPNPVGTVFSPTGAISTVSTTGGVIAAGAINTSINNNQGTANFGNIIINSNVESTGLTTGAFKVIGGAGISGNLFVGGNLSITGNLSIAGNITSVNYETVTNTEYVTRIVASGNAVVNALYTTTGLFWAGNNNVISTGGGGSSTTISLAGTSGTGSVSGGDTLTFAGSNGMTATASGSTITISTPQDLQTTALPTFANVTVANIIINTGGKRNGRNIVTNYSGNTAPAAPLQGDEWFRGNTGVMYKYLYDNVSSTYNWIDMTSALYNANTAAVANTLALRDSAGNLTATNFIGVASSAKYADLAEVYASDKLYEPGTVVIFGGTQEITTTTKTHDTRVAGVISTNPAYLMNSEATGLPVAFTGRVPCRVQGPVTKGAVLVTSAWPGVATTLTDVLFKPGCVLGKALNEITTNEITTIEVVVGRF
jgi:hypothetical protein